MSLQWLKPLLFMIALVRSTTTASTSSLPPCTASEPVPTSCNVGTVAGYYDGMQYVVNDTVFQLVCGQVISGVPIGPDQVAHSLTQCVQLCADNDDCYGASYTADDSNCQLLPQSGTTVDFPGGGEADAAIRISECQVPPSNATTPAATTSTVSIPMTESSITTNSTTAISTASTTSSTPSLTTFSTTATTSANTSITSVTTASIATPTVSLTSTTTISNSTMPSTNSPNTSTIISNLATTSPQRTIDPIFLSTLSTDSSSSTTCDLKTQSSSTNSLGTITSVRQTSPSDASGSHGSVPSTSTDLNAFSETEQTQWAAWETSASKFSSGLYSTDPPSQGSEWENGTSTKSSIEYTATTTRSASWDKWQRPASSASVTVTLTTTFVIPCSTGWKTQTVTLTTGHCGCIETPIPTVVPMTTYITTCPPEWGLGTSAIIVTSPVPVASPSKGIGQISHGAVTASSSNFYTPVPGSASYEAKPSSNTAVSSLTSKADATLAAIWNTWKVSTDSSASWVSSTRVATASSANGWSAESTSESSVKTYTGAATRLFSAVPKMALTMIVAGALLVSLLERLVC